MRGQTELLRVRKQNVAVDLALAGISPRRMELFLPQQPTSADRRQQVLHFLEKGLTFLPARETASGQWEIINRNAVVWIRISLADLGSLGEDPEELFEFRQKVRVDLTSGAPLGGELLYSAQEQETRVTDYMNFEGRFFRLWREDDVYLVNKSYVLRVIEN
jgi:hypothetical protein